MIIFSTKKLNQIISQQNHKLNNKNIQNRNNFNILNKGELKDVKNQNIKDGSSNDNNNFNNNEVVDEGENYGLQNDDEDQLEPIYEDGDEGEKQYEDI